MLTWTISLCVYTVLSGTCRFPEFSLRITEVLAGVTSSRVPMFEMQSRKLQSADSHLWNDGTRKSFAPPQFYYNQDYNAGGDWV
jgi:hypothetical protein